MLFIYQLKSRKILLTSLEPVMLNSSMQLFVASSFANFWGNHFYNGGNERTGSVVFATVSSCITHVFYFVFVQMAHFVLLCMGTETQFVNAVNHFTQIVAALNTFFSSLKISPILYSMVSALSALSLNFLRYGNSLLFTKSVRSSPVSALWSIFNAPFHAPNRPNI